MTSYRKTQMDLLANPFYQWTFYTPLLENSLVCLVPWIDLLPTYNFIALIGYLEGFPFPCGSVVKNQPAKQETQTPSLDQEDPLEKEMATPSSILAWKISWTRGAWWAPIDQRSLWDHKRVRQDKATKQKQHWPFRTLITTATMCVDLPRHILFYNISPKIMSYIIPELL